MDWHAILQSLFSRALWEIIIIVGGGALIGVVKARWPDYAPRVLYGVAGAACIAIILFTLTGHAVLSKYQPEITQDNAEVTIKQWADSMGMGVSRPREDQSLLNTVFFYDAVALHNGTQVMVARAKDLPDYLQLQVQLALPSDDQEALGKLSPRDARMVTEEIILELARARIGTSLYGVGSSPTNAPTLLQRISLLKSVPIEGLTKDQFATALNDLDSAVSLVRATLSLALERKGVRD